MTRPVQMLSFAAVLVLAAMYVVHLQADSWGALFGILWTDEGPYLLTAKHQALRGVPHPFTAELYKPEYTVPLLHRLANATLTADNTVWGIRFLVALSTLGAIALLTYVARPLMAGYRHSTCAILLLLCPMLFFYGRVGLSEGIQLLLLAAVLWCMQRFYARRALAYAALAGAGVAILFLAKITSAPACLGLSLGMVAAAMGASPRQRGLVALGAAMLGGVATAALLYACWIHPNGALWWSNNIATPALAEYMPMTRSGEWLLLQRHYVGLHHFMGLMPIFYLSFAGLLIASAKRGFASVLWVTAVTVLIVESFFGGDLRRNYFGLALLAYLGAIYLPEWVRHGVRGLKTPTRAQLLSLGLAGCFWAGLVSFTIQAFISHDPVYSIGGPLGLLILLSVVLLQGEGRRRWRTAVALLVMLLSLIPLLMQTFLASRTIDDAERAIETVVAEDATISGFIAPWYLQGLRRQTLFTNCQGINLTLANPRDTVPYAENQFYLTAKYVARNEGLCVPPDFAQYEPVWEKKLFFPCNLGPGFGGSAHWTWNRHLVLYRKITAAPAAR